MGKPKAPRPADPRATAGAQTANNIGTAIAQQNLNNVNQETPYGNLNYRQTGSYAYRDPNTGAVHNIPRFTAKQTLNPAQQALFDQNTQTQTNLSRLAGEQSTRLANWLNKPMSLDGLPARGDASAIAAPEFSTGDPIVKTYGTDWSKDRERVEDALMERMNPRLERDRKQLESRLASQGIRIGSEAYNAAMGDYGRQSNDARLGAILAGGREQSRLAGLARDRASFENAAQRQGFSQHNQVERDRFNTGLAQFNARNQGRNQALRERFALRNQPINEITALMSGSQVRNPNFITPKAANIPTTDYAGIQNAHDNAMWDRYKYKNNAWQGALGAGLGFLAGPRLLSDRRAKTDVKKVGRTKDGQNVYSFRYKSGGPIRMGLMAQEVEKKKPRAVTEVGGVKMVDYGIALGSAK